ncbi:Linoleate 9S-lipoxygenase 1 [Spatholobus suberectus]|nr:Linoleate 9S-lipoxygenase 1 [Spatholobus suberectus]
MFGMLNRGHKIKGTVVLMSKNVLDVREVVSTTRGGVVGAAGGILNVATGIAGGIVDGATAIFSRSISLQLISATKTDVSKSAWMTDEEFGREMLAGVNPCMIQCLQEFPPKSKLDATVYGDQTSTITKEHLETNLGGLTVEQALNGKRLFILDHHDAFMPYLGKINSLPTAKSYATRTILFLKDDGTLKPLAIELSLPHPRGDEFGANSRVILPADAGQGAEGTIWLLAKAYVVVNDSCYHQLMSHWKLRQKSLQGTTIQVSETVMGRFRCPTLCFFLPVRKASLSEEFPTASLSKECLCVWLAFQIYLTPQ